MKLFPVLITIAAAAYAASNISDSAYTLVNARTVRNQSQFIVYDNVDSPFNHGFPSGLFGSSAIAMSKLHTDPGCVYSMSTPNGCSSDPTAIDPTRGTVMRYTFDPLVQGEFAGMNFQEPENGISQNGNGFDLTGATQLVLDAVSPTGGIQVQFSVNGSTTGFRSIPQQWSTISIDLNSLGLTSLTGVHLLFGISSNDVNASRGGTVLIDNIRFLPVPTSQTKSLGLPLSNEIFGIQHVPNALPGAIQIPPDQTLANVATAYESSLALIALIDRGQSTDLVNAKLIADTLVYALGHDNRGDALPVNGGATGLHNSTFAGDIALFNSQAQGGQQGQVRLAGFTAPGLCPQTGFCLVLDGATGGNNAFGILALLAGYKQFQNPAYLNAARTLANWIYSGLLDSTGTGYGGYFLGYPDGGLPKILQTGKSTENNADIFAAFIALAAAENTSGDSSAAALWINRANIAGDFVMQMYDSPTGHFFAGTVAANQGTGPGIYPDGANRGNDVINTFDFLDSQTFTTLAMAPAPRYRNQIDWHLPVQWVINHFQRSVTAANGTFLGFDLIEASEHPPTDGPAGIAWEFTGQEVAAMKLVDSIYGTSQFASATATYLNQLQKAQNSAPFGDSQGLVAATLQNGDAIAPYSQCLVTPYQCIAQRVGLAATIWSIVAEQGLNPFLSIPPPAIQQGGIVPIFSTLTTIQPGEWVSIYGTNLSSSTVTWSGDFPTSLGGTNVTINGKSAYLWYVSPTQINLQAPDDTATGPVPVMVTTGSGSSSSTVTLAQLAPSFSLLDNKHVVGIILRSNGSGAYGGGAYDIIGPTGNSLGYATVAAKAGDTVALFAVGLGPTNPVVLGGKAFSGAAPTINPITVNINNVSITPDFGGLSSAGLYQINLRVPPGLGSGDVPLLATVGGAQTQAYAVISVQ